MRRKRLRFIVLNMLVLNVFVLAANELNNQKDYTFHSPLDIPLSLNGNFGEIRPNHFHAGLDLRTNGKSGLNIFAIDEGYVSRIYVSSSGYGRAVYITHPNGLTSVYGHLLKFASKIQARAVVKHYEKESYFMNAFFAPGEIPIKKGEIIALGGNAGSSGGAHLHFEIRDTKTEEVMDPMKYGFDIKDSKRPQITRIRIFPIPGKGMVDGSNDGASFTTVFYSDKFHLKGNPKITVWGEIGIGVEAIDYQDNSWSKCGVSEMKLSVDGKIVYHHKMDRFSFAESRYINTFMDYNLYKTYSRKYMRAYKAEPNNPLSIYKKMEKNGIIPFRDNRSKEIKLEIWDSHMNKSECVFVVAGRQQEIIPLKEKESVAQFKWNQNNTYQANGLTVKVPSGALYSDLDFMCKETSSNKFHSPIYKVHNVYAALQKSMTLKIEAPNLTHNPGQYFIASVYNGRLSGGQTTKRENSTYSITTKYFGEYALALDTIPPKISAVNVSKGKKMYGATKVEFKMEDKESGIRTYRGEIDGKWVMFEQYRTRSNPTYYFDATRIDKNKKHHLKFVVTDNVGNQSTFETDFFW